VQTWANEESNVQLLLVTNVAENGVLHLRGGFKVNETEEEGQLPVAVGVEAVGVGAEAVGATGGGATGTGATGGGATGGGATGRAGQLKSAELAIVPAREPIE